MSQLSNEEILKLAKLARLKLSEAELEQYKLELASILDYVEMLSNVDVSSLEPTNQVTGLVNVFRNDSVAEYTATADALLQAAPDRDGTYIKVKRMI